MNALKIHGLLEQAYEIMKKDDNEETRKVVLALIDLYNLAADKNPTVYRKVRNAGTNDSIWIVAA